MNIWKLITVLLAIVLVFLFVFQYTDLLQKEKINIAGIEIEKETFDKFSESIEGDSFVLCDIGKNKCLVVDDES